MNDPSRWTTLVVGAGPGGISAAIWAHRLGLKTLLIEARGRAGGQLNELNGIVIDYPGFTVQRGYELAPSFIQHLETLGIPVRYNARAEAIDAAARRVVLEGGEILEGHTLILATGAYRRRLNVPGEQMLWGRGVSDSPTRDRELALERRVVVVGGGDAALENALLLADLCLRVTVVHRGSAFRARAEFLEHIARRPNIDVLCNARVLRVEGTEHVTGIEIAQGGGRFSLPTDMVFIKVGVAPRTELVREQLVCDGEGYLTVDRMQETSAPGVYGVGDVCNPVYSSIANAVGQGMIAAKTIDLRMRLGTVVS